MEKLHFPLSEDGRSYVDVNLLEPFPWIQKRGLVLVVPGGAYMKYTPREGEPVALRFAALGYHTAVLRYRFFPDRHPVPCLLYTSSGRKLPLRRAESRGQVTSRVILCRTKKSTGDGVYKVIHAVLTAEQPSHAFFDAGVLVGIHMHTVVVL